MSNSIHWPGKAALMVAHCAGMVDLVALPVWVGTLISEYQFDPQQAGGLATLFLVGAVISSLLFSRKFNVLNGRLVAPMAFACAGVAFFLIPSFSQYFSMALLHVLAGISVGCGLSFTHGTIGRSLTPHRMFALVGMALGLFTIVFLAGTPQLIAKFGGSALFWTFGGIMSFSAVVTAFAFPKTEKVTPQTIKKLLKFNDPAVISCILAISSMALVQAMIFSFLEHIGIERGFGMVAVSGVLIALGFVNLFPAVLAALLEKRWSPKKVVLIGPCLQAILALLISQSPSFIGYTIGAIFFAGVLIFTHTFAFGMLAKLDLSGRAVAATPAMLMTGSAIGPLLGGTLVKDYGYLGLGVCSVLFAAIAILCFYISTCSSVQWHNAPLITKPKHN